MAPTPRLPKPRARFNTDNPEGEDMGGGLRRRPDAPAPPVPRPKPTPGSIDRQGGTSRGGLGQPKYGVTGGGMAKPNANAPLGQGGRFAAVVQDVMREGKSEDQAKAIAASAGRRKLGKAKFQSLAAKGRADG